MTDHVYAPGDFDGALGRAAWPALDDEVEVTIRGRVAWVGPLGFRVEAGTPTDGPTGVERSFWVSDRNALVVEWRVA